MKLPVQESGNQVLGLGERGVGGRVKRSLEVRHGGTRQRRGGCYLQSHSNCYQCYQFFRCCIPSQLCTPAVTPIHRSTIAVVISLWRRTTKAEAEAEAKDTLTTSKYCHVSATCFAQTSSLFSFILRLRLWSFNLGFATFITQASGLVVKSTLHRHCFYFLQRDKQNLILSFGWLDSALDDHKV